MFFQDIQRQISIQDVSPVLLHNINGIFNPSARYEFKLLFTYIYQFYDLFFNNLLKVFLSHVPTVLVLYSCSLSATSPVCVKQCIQWCSCSNHQVFFFNVHLKRLAILSKPTSPDAKNIFVTTPDDSKVLPFFILAGADFTFSFSICGWDPNTVPSRSSFLYPKGESTFRSLSFNKWFS